VVSAFFVVVVGGFGVDGCFFVGCTRHTNSTTTAPVVVPIRLRRERWARAQETRRGRGTERKGKNVRVSSLSLQKKYRQKRNALVGVQQAVHGAGAALGLVLERAARHVGPVGHDGWWGRRTKKEEEGGGRRKGRAFFRERVCARMGGEREREKQNES
jgi:hypothetical protein